MFCDTVVFGSTRSGFRFFVLLHLMQASKQIPALVKFLGNFVEICWTKTQKKTTKCDFCIRLWKQLTAAQQNVSTVAALFVHSVMPRSSRYQTCCRRAAQSQTGYDEVLAFAAVSLRRVKVRSPWHCLTSRPPRWPAVTHLRSARASSRHLITAQMGLRAR